MEHEHQQNAESADLEKQPTRPSVPKPSDAPLEHLRRLQHGLGNRALGRLIQAKYEGGAGAGNDARAGADVLPHDEAAPEVGAATQPAAGDGRPLGEAERAFFGTRFREDFGGVRLHTGAAAAESARSIGARAYAVGQNLVFAEGQYAPHTEGGLRLLAHELAHVAQQRRPGAGGASAESGADAAAEAVASGRAVSPQSIGGAAPGLYADNGFTLSPGSPSVGFKLPPLKVSRKLVLYLLGNNLLTAEMRGMLLRGEIVMEDDGKTTEGPEPEPAARLNLFPHSEIDDLLRRVEQKRAAEEKAAEGAAQAPKPAAAPAPTPDKTPDDKPKLLEWKGVSDGLDFNLPFKSKLPGAISGLANPNLSFSGLTVPVVKVGQFDSKLVAGFDQSIELKLAYRDWHLSGSVDMDGKWLLKLSYPNDSPIPAGGSLESIFSQGETALREALKTAKEADPTKFTELKDKMSTLATPIKSAVDAGKGIKNFERRLNVSIAVGAGPAPGQLPQSALQGQPQPKTPVGLFAGFRIDFYF